MNMRLPLSVAFMLSLLSGACASGSQAEPALLTSADKASMAAIEATLARAMKAPRVTLGPGDLTTSPVISVLPPSPGPLEGRSTAMPILFDLMIDGGQCFLVRRESGEAYPLDGVSCAPQR